MRNVHVCSSFFIQINFRTIACVWVFIRIFWDCQATMHAEKCGSHDCISARLKLWYFQYTSYLHPENYPHSKSFQIELRPFSIGYFTCYHVLALAFDSSSKKFSGLSKNIEQKLFKTSYVAVKRFRVSPQ